MKIDLNPAHAPFPKAHWNTGQYFPTEYRKAAAAAVLEAASREKRRNRPAGQR